MSNTSIEKRVIKAANSILYEKKIVSVTDIFLHMGWLNSTLVQDWRKGKVPFLEKVIQTNLNKISRAIRIFQSWANKNDLKPSETAYLLKTGRTKRELQFTKYGDENLERAYRTHYLSPELSEKKAEKLLQKSSKPEDIIVYILVKDARCSECLKELFKGNLLYMEAGKPLCLDCAGLSHLEYLPSGDANLTRRAKKQSGLWAVVVQYSRTRKRYERRGLLVEKEALKVDNTDER
jgi:hypothetical protein